jgi:poly-beta-1,6-N-acetyl-D-glucosamine synthase
MWLLVFIFVLITALLGWMLFIYFLLLYVTSFFKKSPKPSFPENFPEMTVVIPCYNEEEGIVRKIANLKELEYPREKLRLIFADGGSTDNTLAALRAAQSQGIEFEIADCPRKGKINQLNFVLPNIHSELVVNSDVDAALEKDALKWIAAEFVKDPEVYVVGAFCSPEKTLEIENYYWSSQNKGRLLESDAHSASIVIAQCYAFKRELLDAFPADVVADDIYVAFAANVRGKKAIYSRYALAKETRTPQSYSEFIPHKFRKSNAYLRESLRFLYQLPEMKPFFKLIFFTRLLQQVLLPWALLSWVMVAGVLLTLFRYDIVILDFILLGILFSITGLVFSHLRLPGDSQRYSLMTMMKGYLITISIMLATGLTYPFFRQDSFYERIGKK